MSLFSNRRILNPKTIALGGLAVAAVAGALRNRDKVAGLIGARSSAPEPPAPPPSATGPTAAPVSAPPQSNYDVGGPPANTATPVAAPEAVVEPGGTVDEAAEEAAAAAEAAAIGGGTPDYAGSELHEPADDAERALAEAGGGEAEGQEQAEADLADNAEAAAGDPIEAERQIDEIIEQAGQPAAGEIVEPVAPLDEGGAEEAVPSTDAPPAEQPAGETQLPGLEGDGPAEPTAGDTTTTGGGDTAAETAGDGETVEMDRLGGEDVASGGGDPGVLPGGPSTETPAEDKAKSVWEPPKPPASSDSGDESEWQTWSGRAVDR